MTKNKEFLNWLADRLVHVYGESPNVDFVLKLKAIANNADSDQNLNPCVGLRDHQLTEEEAVFIPVKSPKKIKVPTIDGEIEMEAMRFTEEDKDQVYNWARSIQKNVYQDSEDNKPILRITTIFDGEIICRLGDYLVKTDDEQSLNVV